MILKFSDGYLKFAQVSNLTPSPFPKGKGNDAIF